MRAVGGIRVRLLLIIGLAALAMAVASAVALMALMQARSDLDTVRQRELPASEVALILARVGERLQDRTPALVAAGNAEARRRQTALIDHDLRFLAEETERLQVLNSGHGSSVDDIVRLVPVLAKKLRALGKLLERQAALDRELEARRGRLFFLRDQVRQILGPSILAMADVLKNEMAADSDVFRHAALAQGPLLEAEYLVDAAFAELLVAAEAPAHGALEMARGAFHRALEQLRELMSVFPAGLRREMEQAAGTLDAELAEGGVFALRSAQLTAAAGSEQLVADSRRIGTTLKTKVDDLVVSASHSVMNATAAMGNSILQNTLLLASVSITVILLAALVAYRFVVRDISLSLGAVTHAMQRLAAGERGAQVPAMERHDEIGDLARVFNVFKEQAFRMETLDRELAEKSRLLLATFENMSDGFTVFDGRGRLVAWNPRYLQLYGLAADDVGPGVSLEHLLALVAGTGARTFTPLGEEVPMSDLAGGRDHLSREFHVRCTDGHRVELRSNPIPGGGFVTLHMDITERHAMEGQLRQAQKMEAVGQLTGGIAHDFNNILGAILGNLSALEPAAREREEAYERWRRAMGAVDRATRQVERLLAFSRRQHLAPEEVDLNALVAGMTDLLEYSLGDGVELHTELAPDLPPLQVDPGQLENALMNLAINARDAMTGKGRISFNTARFDADTVKITVIDNGAGMAQEILDRVVEPFFTTKPS
ncbi:MAG: PAS-domain containing protein, partial [Chromatiales bacterium]